MKKENKDGRGGGGDNDYDDDDDDDDDAAHMYSIFKFHPSVDK